MPLFYQNRINETTKLAVWHIVEPESFFLRKMPLKIEIKHPHKRLQYLAGRYLLQQIFPDFPYHLIEIADTGRPVLPNEKYHFSISHCGHYAAVIVSNDQRVGIDIEMIASKIEKVKHKFLSEEELELVNSQWSMVNRQSLLTLLWCCKEAVFKWYGSGGVDFKYDIHLQPSSLTADEGIINCEFVKKEKVSLKINYKMFDEFCLAWIRSKINH